MGNSQLNGKKLVRFQRTKKEINKTWINYRPISLLSVAGKKFEIILYDNMYEFFAENNLISFNQSDFKPSDSCINQLLSITHEIYKSFDDGLKVRGIFLDISNTFDEVWHKGLLLKLKQNGISGKLFDITTKFSNLANGQYLHGLVL